MSTGDISESLKKELARQLATALRPLRNGDMSGALAGAEQVERWVINLDNPLTQARILFQVAEMLNDAGLREEASVYFERSLSFSEHQKGRLAHLGSGLCLQRLGAIHRDAGHFCDALECDQQSLEHSQAIGDLSGAGGAWNNLGLTRHRTGELSAAEENYRRGLRLGEQIGNALLRATNV